MKTIFAVPVLGNHLHGLPGLLRCCVADILHVFCLESDHANHRSVRGIRRSLHRFPPSARMNDMTWHDMTETYDIKQWSIAEAKYWRREGVEESTVAVRVVVACIKTTRSRCSVILYTLKFILVIVIIVSCHHYRSHMELSTYSPQSINTLASGKNVNKFGIYLERLRLTP